MNNLYKYLENNKVFLAKVIHFIDYADTALDKKCLEDLKNSKYKGHYEINNFKKRKDGKVYGFISANNANNCNNTIHIEKLGVSKKDSCIKDCLVIFISDASQVVGYYKDATIYRNLRTNRFSKHYFFETNAKDAILLPYDERIDVELKKGKHPLNFGKAQRKYVDEKNRKAVSDILKKLENNGKENNLYQETSELTTKEKKVLVPHLKYEGRIHQIVVNKIKKEKGYICEVCGFNFSDHYKHLENSNFIELHHLNMYKNLKENETRKLTGDDFAVLCSNCHRMIHKLKPIEGNKKDIEKLKTLYKK